MAPLSAARSSLATTPANDLTKRRCILREAGGVQGKRRERLEALLNYERPREILRRGRLPC